jgi:hypothetical protein
VRSQPSSPEAVELLIAVEQPEAVELFTAVASPEAVEFLLAWAVPEATEPSVATAPPLVWVVPAVAWAAAGPAVSASTATTPPSATRKAPARLVSLVIALSLSWSVRTLVITCFWGQQKWFLLFLSRSCSVDALLAVLLVVALCLLATAETEKR